MEILGDLIQWFSEHLSGADGVPVRVWQHLTVSGAALLAACAVALPLGAWLGHTGRGGVGVAVLVNVGRAVPSFGILAIALPISIRLARNVPFIDSGLGFLPTFIALFFLALPPIFTNTHTGVRTVDREVVEAARGMGVKEARILTSIEMPLASPVILTGIRVTAVQVVATATLGALVAYGGLGRYIIDGFAVQDSTEILAGALLVAVLSILTEVGFSLLERRLVPKGLSTLSRADVEVEMPAPSVSI
jgi:osmoprotectant transport system permease protein